MEGQEMEGEKVEERAEVEEKGRAEVDPVEVLAGCVTREEIEGWWTEMVAKAMKGNAASVGAVKD